MDDRCNNRWSNFQLEKKREKYSSESFYSVAGMLRQISSRRVVVCASIFPDSVSLYKDKTGCSYQTGVVINGIHTRGLCTAYYSTNAWLIPTLYLVKFPVFFTRRIIIHIFFIRMNKKNYLFFRFYGNNFMIVEQILYKYCSVIFLYVEKKKNLI